MYNVYVYNDWQLVDFRVFLQMLQWKFVSKQKRDQAGFQVILFEGTGAVYSTRKYHYALKYEPPVPNVLYV